MSDVLEHHGIKGMKWGVIRTPAQLGHVTKSKRPPTDSAKKQPTAKKSRPPKKLSELTDDELRQRISRLNMEEQYANLVARQKERDTGVVKELLFKAAKNLGEKALGVAIAIPDNSGKRIL